MTSKIKEKLAFKLRKCPADDDLAVPVTCLAEEQALYDMQAITRYTMIKPSELDLKSKRTKIRPYSCHFSSYSFMIKDMVRLGSYVRGLDLSARNELLMMSPSELNVIFRDKEKMPYLKTLVSTTSSQVMGHSRELIEGMKKMVKGGHIIDLVYVKGDKKDQKEQLTTFRRLKFILSQLYHNLLELENLGEEYNQTAELPKVTDENPGTCWEAAWRSGRKRYFDDVLLTLNEKERTEELKSRKTRLRAIDKKKKSYMYLSVTGLGVCKRENESVKAMGICKICDKRNIPFNKLNDHSNNCKRIKDIQQDLLKVNQWLIAECQKAARLKDKLHAFNTPAAPERKLKLNCTHSIRSSDKEGSLAQECMTPNPRLMAHGKSKEKQFITDKKTGAPLLNGSEKESLGSLKTNAEGSNNSFRKFRKCNSNEHIEGDTKAKEKPKEELKKGSKNEKKTKKEGSHRTSMSEDEQSKKPQSQLSSSDEETEKKEQIKPQRFSHFKQYKLPSGNYSNTPERKASNKIESDSSIRSTHGLEVKDDKDEQVPELATQTLETTSVIDDKKDWKVAQPEVKLEEKVDENKKDTAEFLDDMFSGESDDESSKSSAIVDDYHPRPRPSKFASNQPVMQPTLEENKVEPVEDVSDEEEKVQISTPARISGFAFKNSQPAHLSKLLEDKKSKSSSEGSCFGDRFSMDEEEEDDQEEPEPSPPSTFKPSSFNVAKSQLSEAIQVKKEEEEVEKEQEEDKPRNEFKLDLNHQVKVVEAPEALPDSPAFISGLLDNSEEDSNRLGGTSRSEKSSQKQAEDAALDENFDLPPLRPSVSVVVKVSPPTEPEPQPKSELTASNINFLSLLKKKKEDSAVEHGGLSHSAINLGQTMASEDSKGSTQAEGLSKDAIAETKAKKNKFRMLSKKSQFQTQIREDTQAKVKDENKEIDQQNQDLKLLKLAMDCLTQIGFYGEDIRKYPYGENIMIDTKMRDFLSGVEASQQYLIEVKMPSIKILEMVRKRINYIQEIKKIEIEDAKLLKEKKTGSMPVGEGSFRKPKFPTTAFDNKVSFLDMLSKKNEKKDSNDLMSMETQSVSNTPKLLQKTSESVSKGATQLGGQKKSMMQMLKERNTTFTEQTKKRQF